MDILVTCMCGRWHTPWCTVSAHSLYASAEISLGTQQVSCEDFAKIENLPFMISWLLPSMAPLVPSSAKRKASKCWNWQIKSQMSSRFTRIDVQMLTTFDQHCDLLMISAPNLGLPVEHLGDFGEVGKRSFLASNSHHLVRIFGWIQGYNVFLDLFYIILSNQVFFTPVAVSSQTSFSRRRPCRGSCPS